MECGPGEPRLSEKFSARATNAGALKRYQADRNCAKNYFSQVASSYNGFQEKPYNNLQYIITLQ